MYKIMLHIDAAMTPVQSLYNSMGLYGASTWWHVSIVGPLHASLQGYSPIDALLSTENIVPYEVMNTPINFGSLCAYVQGSLMGTKGDFKQRWGHQESDDLPGNGYTLPDVYLWPGAICSIDHSIRPKNYRMSRLSAHVYQA